jgi:hypothetical protein
MKPFYTAIMAYLAFVSPVWAASPVVLELFTSQGCSSCPPADALLQKLSADPHILALSFHIDYWDQDEWKDPFSLPTATARQTQYVRVLKQDNLYTPELVVDGQRAMIGSRSNEIETSIEVASQHPKPLSVLLTPDPSGKTLSVTFTGQMPGDVPVAGVWLITYSPKATTAVRGGENSGREMTSVNNVTSLTRLGQIADRAPKPMTAPMTAAADNGYAVLVQEPSGRVIGAGSYQP